MNKKTIVTIPVMNRLVNRVGVKRVWDAVSAVRPDRILLCMDSSVRDVYDRSSTYCSDFNNLSENLKAFGDLGVSTGVWFSSFGHGTRLEHQDADDDGTGIFTQMVSITGSPIPYTFCPLDPLFRRTLAELARNAAAAGARILLLDDDFRLGERAHGQTGCCCDAHLQEMQRLSGRKLSPKDVQEQVFNGSPSPLRDHWFKLMGDSMRDCARIVRQSVDDVDPTVRIGVCAIGSMWGGDSDTHAIEIAQILAGNTRPFMRLSGAPYWSVFQLATLASIIGFERLQSHWCRDIDIELMTEGDVYPRDRNQIPAAPLEAFDGALRADRRIDGILKYISDYVSNPEQETGYVARHIRNAPQYAWIEQHLSASPPGGVRIFNAMQQVQSAHLTDNYGSFIGVPGVIQFIAHNSLPFCFEDKTDVTVVFGENARYVALSAISRGAVIDAPAAALLAARGVDVGLTHCRPSTFTPSVEHFLQQDDYVSLSGDARFYEGALHPECEVLSTAMRAGKSIPLCYRYTNPQGQHFLVYLLDAAVSRNNIRLSKSYLRQQQLIDGIRKIAPEQLPAICPGNPEIYIACAKIGDGLAVGIWNLHSDTIYTPEILTSRQYEHIEMFEGTGELNGDKVTLHNPIYPFGFTGIVLN